MKKQGSKWPTIRSRKDQRIEALEAALAEVRAKTFLECSQMAEEHRLVWCLSRKGSVSDVLAIFRDALKWRATIDAAPEGGAVASGSLAADGGTPDASGPLASGIPKFIAKRSGREN